MCENTKKILNDSESGAVVLRWVKDTCPTRFPRVLSTDHEFSECDLEWDQTAGPKGRALHQTQV